MDWWMIVLIAGGALLLLARVVVGPAPTRSKPDPVDNGPGDSDDEAADPEPWTPEAVARYGTETTVADFARQGRADELRGLGYDGDIPPP